MKFKEWLISEELYPQNMTATVYHRTKSGLLSTYGIVGSDFITSGSGRNGAGLYTTLLLKNQFEADMKKSYGNTIVKFVVSDLDKYLIFNLNEISKSIKGIESIIGIESINEKNYFSYQLKKLKIYDKVIENAKSFYKEMSKASQDDPSMPLGWSSSRLLGIKGWDDAFIESAFADDVQWFYETNQWISTTGEVKGLIYIDGHGIVLLKYPPIMDNSIKLLAYSIQKETESDEEKYNDLKNNKGWITGSSIASFKSIQKRPQETREKYLQKWISNDEKNAIKSMTDKVIQGETSFENFANYLKTNFPKNDSAIIEFINHVSISSATDSEFLKDGIKLETFSLMIRQAVDKDNIIQQIINKLPQMWNDIFVKSSEFVIVPAVDNALFILKDINSDAFILEIIRGLAKRKSKKTNQELIGSLIRKATDKFKIFEEICKNLDLSDLNIKIISGILQYFSRDASKFKEAYNYIYNAKQKEFSKDEIKYLINTYEDKIVDLLGSENINKLSVDDLKSITSNRPYSEYLSNLLNKYIKTPTYNQAQPMTQQNAIPNMPNAKATPTQKSKSWFNFLFNRNK